MLDETDQKNVSFPTILTLNQQLITPDTEYEESEKSRMNTGIRNRKKDMATEKEKEDAAKAILEKYKSQEEIADVIVADLDAQIANQNKYDVQSRFGSGVNRV